MHHFHDFEAGISKSLEKMAWNHTF